MKGFGTEILLALQVIKQYKREDSIDFFSLDFFVQI